MKDLKIQILTYKLQGLSPRAISDKLGISIQTVMKEDKAITKMMKNSDEEDIANMSPDELKLAVSTVKTLLPYMEKNLDAVQRANKSLQTVHKTALDVAENAMNIINTKMNNTEISTSELGQLIDMFSTVYNSLYNKNGIQIINMLANAGSDPKQDELEEHKEMMRIEMDKIRPKAPPIIEAEVE